MLVSLILGIAAGWGALFAVTKVFAALEIVLLDDVPFEATEMRMFTFAVCVVGAAIASMIFAEPHAAPLAIGAAVGIFGPRLINKWKTSRTPD